MRKVIQRQMGRDFMVITAELRENDSRGLSDGFSVTAHLYEPHGTWSGKARFDNGRDCDSAGAMHTEILKFAPELAPVVAVHLADPDGTPMGAIANGWYFYSGKASAYERDSWSNPEGLSDRERAARALHIPVDDLPEGLDREGFTSFAESLRERWAAQAAEAKAVIESL